ncbi:MAG: hypothetical protein AB1551_05490 [Actinomycetota bacterium]
MLAWGPLEWTFVVILVALTGLVGALFLFVVARFFVNPGRGSKGP